MATPNGVLSIIKGVAVVLEAMEGLGSVCVSTSYFARVSGLVAGPTLHTGSRKMLSSPPHGVAKSLGCGESTEVKGLCSQQVAAV